MHIFDICNVVENKFCTYQMQQSILIMIISPFFLTWFFFFLRIKSWNFIKRKINRYWLKIQNRGVEEHPPFTLRNL